MAANSADNTVTVFQVIASGQIDEVPSGRIRLWAGFLMLALLLACLLAGGAASAANGRDFAGFYALADTTDLGELMRFNFRLRVFNYSDEDVSNCTVVLSDSLLPGKEYGVFSGVSIIRNESARLAQTMTMPRREYERWGQGAAPNVVIRFKDSKNQDHQQRVELLRKPGI